MVSGQSNVIESSPPVPVAMPPLAGAPPLPAPPLGVPPAPGGAPPFVAEPPAPGVPLPPHAPPYDAPPFPLPDGEGAAPLPALLHAADTRQASAAVAAPRNRWNDEAVTLPRIMSEKLRV